MEPDEPIGDSERLGPSSVLGIASTVSDLIAILAKIYPGVGVRCGDSQQNGLAVHFHTFVNPDRDYVSVTEVERAME
jgi:hypothetical protein